MEWAGAPRGCRHVVVGGGLQALTKALGPRTDSGPSFVDPFHVPDEIRLRAAPKAVANSGGPE